LLIDKEILLCPRVFRENLQSKLTTMKKLLILLMAFSLFTACNNDKTAARNDRDTRNSRDKDDYRSNDRDDKDTRDDDRTDTRNDDRDDDRKDTRDDDRTSSSGWSSKDVNDFNTSCIESAVSGMDRSTATRYCECMQVKLEKLYPNPNDAANIDLESNSMKQMVQDCLY
jgi:hypothetical protein